MAQKPAYRIHPYPTIKSLLGDFWLLFIATVTVVGLILAGLSIKDPELWILLAIVLAVYIFLLTKFGPSLIGQIKVYRDPNFFRESSLTTNAEVLEKSIQEHENYNSYWLTISFNANTISKSMQLQKLILRIPHALYQDITDTVNVRYSTMNPRIAILEGEEGISVDQADAADSAESDLGEEDEPLWPTPEKKQGIAIVENFAFKPDQFYKLYAENNWLYGARTTSQTASGRDPYDMIKLYDKLDLNSKQFLIEDKYNFKYFRGELESIRLTKSKRSYNGERYFGKLEISRQDGKKRSFLISSDLEQARIILRSAGFSVP